MERNLEVDIIRARALIVLNVEVAKST
jgi:hypothetical protein